MGKFNCSTLQKRDIFSSHCKELKDVLQHGDCNFDESLYPKFSSAIVDQFKLLSRNNPDKRKIILENFSRESWEKLTLEEKKKHSVIDRKGCLGFSSLKHGLSLFPIKAEIIISKAKKHGLIRKPLQDITNFTEKQKEQKIKRKLVRQIEEKKEKTAVARYGFHFVYLLFHLLRCYFPCLLSSPPF